MDMDIDSETEETNFVILAPDTDYDNHSDFEDDIVVGETPRANRHSEVHSNTLVDTTAFLARLEGRGRDTEDSGQRGRVVQPQRAGPDSAPGRASWPASSESASGPRGRRPSDFDDRDGGSPVSNGSTADRAGVNSFDLPRTSTEFVTFCRNHQLLDEMGRKDQQLDKMAAELESLRRETAAHKEEAKQPSDITNTANPVGYGLLRSAPVESDSNDNAVPHQQEAASATNIDQARRLPTLKHGRFYGSTPLRSKHF